MENTETKHVKKGAGHPVTYINVKQSEKHGLKQSCWKDLLNTFVPKHGSYYCDRNRASVIKLLRVLD